MACASSDAGGSVALPIPGDALSLTYRPLAPGDAQQCRELHSVLFPIEYEEEFYTKSVNGLDGERTGKWLRDRPAAFTAFPRSAAAAASPQGVPSPPACHAPRAPAGAPAPPAPRPSALPRGPHSLPAASPLPPASPEGIFSFAAFMACPGAPPGGFLVGVITTRLCSEDDPDAKARRGPRRARGQRNGAEPPQGPDAHRRRLRRRHGPQSSAAPAPPDDRRGPDPPCAVCPLAPTLALTLPAPAHPAHPAVRSPPG